MSETQDALYPPVAFATCACGSMYIPTGTAGDDPEKCLTCNRAPWSKLFKRQARKARTRKESPVLAKVAQFSSRGKR